MWEHRNNVLHKEGTTIHHYEFRILDQVITTKWNRGLWFFQRYIYYFEVLKLMLIKNNGGVWMAQEFRQLDRLDRDVHAVNFLGGWKDQNICPLLMQD